MEDNRVLNPAGSDDEEEDGVPKLRPDTLAALQEFLQEKMSEMEEQAEVGKGEPGVSEGCGSVFAKDMAKLFPEDWQMSQFWYDDETSEKLATEVLRLGGKIACLSCPSVFRACNGAEDVLLFEYDRRFEVFGNLFHFYDYNQPEKIPQEFHGAFNVVIADPPFLSEECLSKLAEAVRLISRSDSKIILCTGAVMTPHVENLLGLKKTLFLPRHRNNLGNEFSCFSNYDFPLNSE